MTRRVRVSSPTFFDDRAANYRWLLTHEPVRRERVSHLFNATFVARYDDCAAVLIDSRFCRDRRTALPGARSFPLPIPKRLEFLARSMINADDPDHRRQRSLVQKAFSPKAISALESRLVATIEPLLDELERDRDVDLLSAYASRVPAAVIASMVGVSAANMPRFQNGLRVLNDGMSGWSMVRTILADLPRLIRFIRDLVERKRAAPEDDILSALIHADEAGHVLSDDELVSLVFLLTIAGYETTAHLISNGLLALLDHPL